MALKQRPVSSTQTIPETGSVPQHVAIIMDGNGRWATERHLPRAAGHSKGVDRVEEIASTPGLDGLYIGPADLTLGLTGTTYRTGFDREEPEMVEAIRHILAVAHRAGKRACLHNGSAAYAAKAIGWGFDLVTVSNDVRLLAGAAEASVAEVRRLLQGQPKASSPAQAGGY